LTFIMDSPNLRGWTARNFGSSSSAAMSPSKNGSPSARAFELWPMKNKTRELMDLFRGARLDVSGSYGGQTRAAFGRHMRLDVYQKIEVNWNPGSEKMHVYGELLREMLRDQIRWIYNRNHPRKLTHENGRDSLAMAIEATTLADLPI